MKKYRVLILKNYDNKILELIRECFPGDWEITARSLPEGEKHLPEADIIIPEHAILTDELIGRAGNLKIVQTGAGYDSVDLAAAFRHKVIVANAPGVNSTDVAEHVFGFIFSWFKQIIRLDRRMKNGEWPAEKTGKTISGLMIGIIGCGNIGSKTALIAQSLGMKILLYSRNELKPENFIFKFEQHSFEDILKKSDVISLHIPLTEQTRHIIGARELSKMKKSAFLVNTSRGGLIDQEALFNALEKRIIAGAGIDVFEEEPLPADSGLRQLDNIIITPHTAGEPDNIESSKNRFTYFYRNIQKIIDNTGDAAIIRL